MSFELARDVVDHSRKVAPVNRSHVVPARPANRAWDPSVCAGRCDAFGKPDEVAEPCVRSKGHDQVHVIDEHCASQNLDSGSFSGACYRTSDIRGGGSIHTSDSLICVPRDVRVHLKRVVGHPAAECMWVTDPGRKPGVKQRSAVCSFLEDRNLAGGTQQNGSVG